MVAQLYRCNNANLTVTFVGKPPPYLIIKSNQVNFKLVFRLFSITLNYQRFIFSIGWNISQLTYLSLSKTFHFDIDIY